MSGPSFAGRLLAWFDAHGRKDLPWQHPREPYRVWLSEIMLQQTQVTTVIPYFLRFLERFPTVESLARAPIDDVLQHWAGLGYYARARNLHRAAQLVVERYAGQWPRDLEAMMALPGVGRSTAAAILAQAFGERHAILDANVKRVLARHEGIAGWPGLPAVQTRLWAASEALLPQARLPDYTQAIMDLGAGLCLPRKPQCPACPVAASCVARREQRTQEIPAAKPKSRRARPQKRAQVLLIENARGELLLERRPPTGIWGGLWCPPVIDEGEDWKAALSTRYGLHSSAAPQALPAVQHGFTHFDLELQPLRLRAEAASAVMEAAERAWRRIDDPAALPGLPAPMRKLLLALAAAEPPQIALWPDAPTGAAGS